MPKRDYFQVYNETRDTWLAERAWRADSFWARSVGLLGQASLAPGAALWIEPCQSIHSFFMRFRFDVAFLDREGRVVHLIQSMPPWRASRIVTRARAVLELPAGVLAATGTTLGDRLTVVPIRQPMATG
jgi:uncharacterized membrane protein (UPF0127 family)